MLDQRLTASMIAAACMVWPVAQHAHAAPGIAGPTLIQGVTASATPPAGFDPLVASDTELLRYDYPARPDARANPEAYDHWERAMRAIKSRIIPELRATNVRHGPNIPARAASPMPSSVSTTTPTANSLNWSGYVDANAATAFGTTAFTSVTATFVVPNVSNAVCNAIWDYGSEWVGIDGWTSNDVLQSGAESDSYCGGGVAFTSYDAWIEWYPNPELVITNFPVAAGDDLYIVVKATNATSGVIFIENLNSGLAGSVKINPPSGTNLIGSSAEWIVEQPSVNGALATLPNYAIDYFSGVSATLGSGKVYAPSSGGIQVSMVQNGGGLISQAKLLGANTIIFQYQ